MELRDHHDELLKDCEARNLNATQTRNFIREKLGSEDRLVQETLARNELLSLPGRYPKLVYVAAPLLSYVAIILVLVVLLAAVLQAGLIGSTPNALHDRAMSSASFFLEYLLTPLLVVLWCLLAKLNYSVLRWPLLGILLLSIVGSGWDINYRIATEEATASWSLYWGYAFAPFEAIQKPWDDTFWQLFRLILALAAGALTFSYYRPEFESQSA